MKTLRRKPNNTAFDNLIRSQIGRPAGSRFACAEFDPDRANAYIERGLAGVERTRYERHLSNCAGCRTSVVALARMAEADSTGSAVPNPGRKPGRGESGWLASVKAGLWVIASPRWAIVAAALVAISISIPVLVWRGGAPQTVPDTYVAQVDKNAPAPPATPMLGDSISNAAAGPANSSSQTAPSVKLADREMARREKPGDDAKKDQDETNGHVAALAEQPPAVDSVTRRKTENGDVAGARVDDVITKETAEKASARAPAPAPTAPAEENKAVAKISKDIALKLPEDKSSANVRTLKPGTVDAGPKTERDKDPVALSTITPKDGVAPKRKAALENEPRAGLSSSGTRALVGGESGRPDRAHSPEKKVGKKTFWLSRGVWTDSEYNSDHKFPVVTVVRDSDVYKEMLEKNNKLKALFKGFLDTERAIIVFKSTVYNLIPQTENK